ncbi:MAG: DUF2341 domain-containing protein [Kiritimatiellae bacterium]|nr:DUF2341 domain-containing protein [Kiritimatiellia bacterium]
MHTKKTSLMTVCAALLWTAGLRADWLDGWSYRQPVAVDHAQVTAALTNFPLLVRLDADSFDFALARADGTDLRFTAADGTTLLDFERELHDAAAKQAAYWVRLPLVSSVSNTLFYMYYGNSGADGANADGVWDGSHVGVWHMHTTNGVTQPDSTARGVDLTIGPAGLATGIVSITDCESLDGWTGTLLSLHTTRDPNVAGAYAVRDTVSSVAVGQTNKIVYQPATSLALGTRHLVFFFLCSKDDDTFTSERVTIYDTMGNYRRHNLVAWFGANWKYMGYPIASGGTTGGTAPDPNAIARIEWEFVSKDATAYTVNIDSLRAVGGIGEEQAGVIGNAVSLSRPNHYLATAVKSLDTTNGLTYSAWVRALDSAVDWPWDAMIVDIGGSNWPGYYYTMMAYRDGKNFKALTCGQGGTLESTVSGFSTGVWHHVAGVYHYDIVTDTTTVKGYMDGSLVINKSESGRKMFKTDNRPICVGAMTADGSPPANQPSGNIHADLDEVRVSLISRSEAWVKASYNNQKVGNSFLMFGAPESTASWLPGWKYRKAIAIDSSLIDEDLTNFPVLVRLTAQNFDFARARTDGGDVRFTAGDGGTPLYFERESYDALNAQAVFWVNVPLVSSSADTVFYLYFRRTDAGDVQNPAEVWDSSHVGVWHMQTSNGVTQPDSTAGDVDLTIGPAGLTTGNVAITDCESLERWTGTLLSLHTTRDPNVAGTSAVRDTVSSVSVGQTNKIVYEPAAPMALGTRQLVFFFQCSKDDNQFTSERVTFYDTTGNYRRQNLDAWNGINWKHLGCSIASGGTIGATAPDPNAIARIEWEFVSSDATAYTVNIDSLRAVGAIGEGQAGVIGNAVSLSRPYHYLATAVKSIDTTNGLTYSAWVRPLDSAVDWAHDSHIVAIGDTSWNPYYYAMLSYRNNKSFKAYASGTGGDGGAIVDGIFTTGVWHHVVGVYHYDTGTDTTTVKGYFDGSLVINKSNSGRRLFEKLSRSICVGATTTGYSPQPGNMPAANIHADLDEVRVSVTSRSGAWVKASYLNQKAGSEFLDFRGIEPPSGTLLMLR